MSITGKWTTRVRTNWRGAIWVVVAALTFALAVVISQYAREGFAPGEPEKATRAFLGAWNLADYRRAYSYLDTSVSSDIFIDAVTHTGAPVRDTRFEQVLQQDDSHAIVSYSASIPDAVAAATGIVVANRLRYADSCLDANSRGSRYVRVTDTLALERGANGAWKIGFRGSSDFLQRGASAVGLAFDLTPRFIWGHISADADASNAAYDDQTIFESLAVYRNDVGSLPIDDPGPASPDLVKLRVKAVAAACGGVGG